MLQKSTVEELKAFNIYRAMFSRQQAAVIIQERVCPTEVRVDDLGEVSVRVETVRCVLSNSPFNTFDIITIVYIEILFSELHGEQLACTCFQVFITLLLGSRYSPTADHTSKDTQDERRLQRFVLFGSENCIFSTSRVASSRSRLK